MVSFEEFRNIFRDTGFRERELRAFYHSIRKSLLLKYVGKRAWPDLLRLEERCQWPVLQKIANADLTIYQNADRELLGRFMRSIAEEEGIRGKRSSSGKTSDWPRLRSLIEERIELFVHIFGFSKADIKRCRAVAERFSTIAEKKAANRKKLWKIGISAGAVTFAGAAALWYISKKEKEEDSGRSDAGSGS